ncbi:MULTISPECIES: putative quinol monooxygenase [unclassified Flagellimonas]|jgi:quinol monooxygenase YgiN|uniref:Antibiotic biosynthesis monooxygenase n=1 Tax=Flagellimonas sp. MMG031 TaxID=3158549 RepID=A0AAU7N3X1_9FLAO
MKTPKHIASVATLLIVTVFLIGWGVEQDTVTTEPTTIVVLKFKAQPNKSDQAISALNKLFEKVKEEPNFVSIKLHIDPVDHTNIMLYEEWEDQSYYNNEHMNTAHLQSFMANSVNFLTGPPEISFWEVKGVID